MQRVPIERIRNVGVIAHPGAGRTTTIERMIVHSRALFAPPRHGDREWDELVGDRASPRADLIVCGFPWHLVDLDYRVNVVDIPRHTDFTIEVERSLRILDGAIAIFDAVTGVEPHAEQLWRQASHSGTPRMAFVNKMDRLGADYGRVIAAIAERLGARPALLQMSIVAEGRVRGVVDLIEMRAMIWREGASSAAPDDVAVPEDLREAAKEARELLIEAVADCDEALMSSYLEGELIEAEALHRAVRAATLRSHVVPVLCGSASKDRGVRPLLDAVVRYLPSPVDVPPPEGAKLERGGALALEPHGSAAASADPEAGGAAPLVALAFWAERGARAAVWLRVHSGTLVTGSMILNANRNERTRAGSIVDADVSGRLTSDLESARVDEAHVGEIVIMFGAHNVEAGDTLYDPDRPILLEASIDPRPSIRLEVEAVEVNDEAKLEHVLGWLAEEEGVLWRAGRGGQSSSLEVRDESHARRVTERLVQDAGFPLILGAPQVAYIEVVLRGASYRERYARTNEGGSTLSRLSSACALERSGAGWCSFQRSRRSPRHISRRSSAARARRLRRAGPPVFLSLILRLSSSITLGAPRVRSRRHSSCARRCHFAAHSSARSSSYSSR